MRLTTALTYVLPHRLLSSMARSLAYSDDPRVSRWLIDTVTRKFNEVLCTWASVAARPSTACPPAPSSGSAATCRRWRPSTTARPRSTRSASRRRSTGSARSSPSTTVSPRRRW
ncbi:hypothetical protein G6F46_014491 [Rhizopus delemar]|nr:hypothetical protein G6F46_014491 [Rhizopus delemar]